MVSDLEALGQSPVFLLKHSVRNFFQQGSVNQKQWQQKVTSQQPPLVMMSHRIQTESDDVM